MPPEQAPLEPEPAEPRVRPYRSLLWALAASAIYFAVLYWMFHEPAGADSFRGLLFILLTAPASFLVLALHLNPPMITLPAINALLVLSPVWITAIIRFLRGD